LEPGRLETFLVGARTFQDGLSGLRAPSRIASAAAIIALFVVASLSVAVIDSHSLSDPLQRDLVRPGSAPLPPTGTLVITMVSNQNFGSAVSPPLPTAIPLPKWPIAVVTINSSVISIEPISLTTDPEGVAVDTLLPGDYVVEAPYNTLNIQVPVVILSGNTTTVELDMTEHAYSLVYTEASDVGAQPSLYVELRSSTSVANVSEPVTIGLQNGGPAGDEVYATVVSERPPAQGTQWLDLGSTAEVDLAGVGAAILATWSYSSTVNVQSTAQSGGLLAL
jgi:hypothetical protein